MAYVVRGDREPVIEVTRETGPQGKVLKGDDATGLGHHQEAVRSLKERNKNPAGGIIGFPDTPAVTAAFDSMKDAKSKLADGDAAATQAATEAGNKASAAAEASIHDAASEDRTTALDGVKSAEAKLDVETKRQDLDRAEGHFDSLGPDAEVDEPDGSDEAPEKELSESAQAAKDEKARLRIKHQQPVTVPDKPARKGGPQKKAGA